MEITDDLTESTTADGSDDAVEQPAIPRGTVLGRYVIIKPIGSGGMGTVYQAYDPQLNRGVALKILSVKHENLQAAEKAKARLIREAQALAQSSHPNVVAVHDAGTFEDDVFIAMELVEGKTLDEWMKAEKRSVAETLKVMTAAGRGLSAAHEAGLIHRDFKPGNVIVGDDGRVRVLDFGLACAVDQAEEIEEKSPVSEPLPETPNERSHESKDPFYWKEISSDSSPNLLQTPLTNVGGILGTPMYMAPEQHLGLKTDERTDQFGFCIVLYEALYGKRPFAASSMKKLKSKVIRQKFSVPSAETDVPTWLWQIIRKGLSVKPEDRYATIDSLLEDLDKDPEDVRRQKQLARRRKLLVISLIQLTILLPIGVWYGLRYRTVQLCKAVEGELAGVWDNQTKDSIRTTFINTEASFARETWARVERNFDRYLSEWTQMRIEVCEARLVRGTQSEELFDLRMRCLRKRLQDVHSLTKVLSTADAAVVQKAIQASLSVDDISICANEEALRLPYPPPKNTAEETVKALQAKLSEAFALNRTGKYQEGLHLAKAIAKEAHEVDYRPIQAQALYCLGSLLYRNGEYKAAEKSLNEAAVAAGESKNMLLAAQAMGVLVSVVGYRQARYEAGLLIGRHAGVMLSATDGHDRVRASLLNNVGVVYRHMGDYDQALHYFNKSLEIRDRTLGPEHPEMAYTLNNLGIVYRQREDFEKSLSYYRRTLRILEKTLGAEHPHVAVSHNNLGNLFLVKGDYVNSLSYHRKSLAIREKSLGPDHPYVAYPLEGICNAHILQGRAHDAVKQLERLFALCTKNPCNPGPHGVALFGLAQAFVADGKRRGRAIKLAKDAQALYEKYPNRFKIELEEVIAWLQEYDH